jgi:hypothetical protein
MSEEDVARDHVRLTELSKQYEVLEAQLQELYQSWEQALAEAAALTTSTS